MDILSVVIPSARIYCFHPTQEERSGKFICVFSDVSTAAAQILLCSNEMSPSNTAVTQLKTFNAFICNQAVTLGLKDIGQEFWKRISLELEQYQKQERMFRDVGHAVPALSTGFQVTETPYFS